VLRVCDGRAWDWVEGGLVFLWGFGMAFVLPLF